MKKQNQISQLQDYATYLNPSFFNKLAILSWVIVGILTMAMSLTLQAQQYQLNSLQSINLNKAAGYANTTHNVATLAPKPNGGAYIQWATNNGFNNRRRCDATSNVYVTEVNNAGQVQGADIHLGQSLPYGIAATPTGFGYLIGDGDKLIFRTVNNRNQTGSTTIMNHRAKGNCAFYTPFPEGGLADPGLDFGITGAAWAFSTPYLPEKGDIAFGGTEFATAFGHSNDFIRSTTNAATHDTHSGDAYITFNQTAGNARLSEAQGDHSLDRRIEYIGNNTFVSLRLNDVSGLRLYKHKNGQLIDNDRLFVTKTDYTNQNGSMTSDQSYQTKRCPNNPNCPMENSYGIGGNGGGTSFGFLGDLHSVGDGTLALTYGIRPGNFEHGTGAYVQKQTKNQLDFARLDANGNVLIRRNLFQPDGRVGQGNYTQFQPYERLAWVKSVMVPSGYVIFFRTESSDGAANNPKYTQGTIRMMQVDANGIITQQPTPVPAAASFNRSDEVEMLTNGTIAWASTTDGQLKLHLIPADQAITIPSAAPVAQAATNISETGFTAHWTAVGNATAYRIDLSTDNFQTFISKDQFVSGTRYTFNNLLHATNFQYRVRAFNSAGSTSNSNVANVQTLTANTVSSLACAPERKPNLYSTTTTSVQFKDQDGNILISNTADEAVSYQDFTGNPNLVLKVQQGALLLHKIISRHGIAKGQEKTKIWLDINRDGKFNETNELLFSQLINNVEDTVLIPATIPASMYRMRIRKGWDFKNACHENNYTQLEDYAVQISAAPASTSPITAGTYTITARHSGKVIDGAGGAANFNILQWEGKYSNNQKWVVEPIAGGPYFFLKCLGRKGRYVEVTGLNGGANVALRNTDLGKPNQQFVAIPSEDGNYFYIAPKENENIVLDVDRQSTDNGPNIGLWTKGQYHNQQFKFTRLPDSL